MYLFVGTSCCLYIDVYSIYGYIYTCVYTSLYVYIYIHANFQAVATLSTTESRIRPAPMAASANLIDFGMGKSTGIHWESRFLQAPHCPLLRCSDCSAHRSGPRVHGSTAAARWFFFAEPMNASFRRVDERSSPKKGTGPNPKHISILPNMKLNPDWVLDLFIFRSPKLRASNFTDFTVVPWD